MDGIEPKEIGSLGTTIEDITAINHLLQSPRLAHIWFTLDVEGNLFVEEADMNHFMWGGFTVTEISDLLSDSVPQSTLHNDMEKLDEIGAVRTEKTAQSTGYRAKFFQTEAENIDLVGGSGLVGPPIIGLVGEAFIDEEVQQFLHTHGYQLLDDALQLYRGSLRGDLDRPLPDMFPEVNDAEINAILPAINRVLLEMSRDPLWEGDYQSQLSSNDVN